jgi:hypothetical protein
MNDAEAVIDVLEGAASAMRDGPYRRGSAVRLPSSGRLLATGDLHDNPFHLKKIIAAARLDASTEHHVVLHELIHGERLINGMDFSYRMLARVAQLVLEHHGQVHPVLANHEMAQLTGKGVSKGAGNSVELFHDALSFTFGDEWETVAGAVRTFIRAMALAVLSEGGVLCAHSLPNARAAGQFDPDVLDRELDEADYLSPSGAAYLMTWGRTYDDTFVAKLAQHWDVKLFCLGHEHAETGIELRGERVIILNSDHERATVLPIDLAQVPSAEETLMHALPLAAIAEP